MWFTGPPSKYASDHTVKWWRLLRLLLGGSLLVSGLEGTYVLDWLRRADLLMTHVVPLQLGGFPHQRDTTLADVEKPGL